jgi:hypothetical protein
MDPNRINYTEYFRNRFLKHDERFKKIIEESTRMESKESIRKKRKYQEAFAQNPPYTRFSDENENEEFYNLGNLKPSTST